MGRTKKYTDERVVYLYKLSDLAVGFILSGQLSKADEILNEEFIQVYETTHGRNRLLLRKLPIYHKYLADKREKTANVIRLLKMRSEFLKTSSIKLNKNFSDALDDPNMEGSLNELVECFQKHGLHPPSTREAFAEWVLRRINN